jgi:hypothetical protein
MADDPVATLTALAAWYRGDEDLDIRPEPGGAEMAEHIDSVIARHKTWNAFGYAVRTAIGEDVRELLAVAEELGVKP